MKKLEQTFALTVLTNQIFLSVFLMILGQSLVCSSANAQQNIEPNVYVSSTIGDSDSTIGPQLIYFVKQDIQNSGRYLLSTDPNLDEYSLVIITINDDTVNGNEFSDAYSATLTFHFKAKNEMDWFLTSRVGTCGTEVVQSCAQAIVAAFVNYIDDFRASNSQN